MLEKTRMILCLSLLCLWYIGNTDATYNFNNNYANQPFSWERSGLGNRWNSPSYYPSKMRPNSNYPYYRNTQMTSPVLNFMESTNGGNAQPIFTTGNNAQTAFIQNQRNGGSAQPFSTTDNNAQTAFFQNQPRVNTNTMANGGNGQANNFLNQQTVNPTVNVNGGSSQSLFGNRNNNGRVQNGGNGGSILGANREMVNPNNRMLPKDGNGGNGQVQSTFAVPMKYQVVMTQNGDGEMEPQMMMVEDDSFFPDQVDDGGSIMGDMNYMHTIAILATTLVVASSISNIASNDFGTPSVVDDII